MSHDVHAQRYQHSFGYPSDHPSFAGHFPGHPLVAGVLLLEQVADALRAWRGLRLARVLEAKFVATLGPDEQAELELVEQRPGTADGRIRFEIRRGDALLARGIVQGDAGGGGA